MIEKNHSSLSVGAQCHLLSISRSSFYDEPMGETAMNLDLMVVIDFCWITGEAPSEGGSNAQITFRRLNGQCIMYIRKFFSTISARRFLFCRKVSFSFGTRSKKRSGRRLRRG